jgi:hypothetical protein
MIALIIKSKDHETMIQKRNEFHEALVGSPAYKKSEIAICEMKEDETSFMLVVGNNNINNISKIIDSDDLMDSIIPVGINSDTLS